MRRLRPGGRRALLAVHIASSVGLLGASAGLTMTAVVTATTGDPELSDSGWHLVRTSGLVFGIPLSFSGLISGTLLGLGSKWGVFRHLWVMAKLALLVSTILVGALVIGPGADHLAAGSGGSPGLVAAGAGWNVAALLTSVILSVYKPGGRRRRAVTP
jgi:predicted integral membrane protein DUF2269